MLSVSSVFRARFGVHAVLLMLSGAHLVGFGIIAGLELNQAEGIVLSDDTTPVGGDFINLWTAGQLLREGRTDEVYDPQAFMSYQWERAGTPTGFRVWAYPPHSLLLAWVFGRPAYLLSWLLWSFLGLSTLWWGARRMGLSRGLSSLLLLSPAVIHCLFLGQTGNFAGGLLMAALGGRRRLDGVGGMSAAALTIKPQLGFLLPVLWAVHGRWRQIAVVSGFVAVLVGVSVGILGSGTWRDYLGLTLPALAWFEREGSGPFVYLMPSLFMAIRILTHDGSLAGWIHLLFALPALGFCVFRMVKATDELHRNALVLLGTVVIAPYLHVYDLAILFAGALILLQRQRAAQDVPSGLSAPNRVERAILLAWALPYITLLGNMAGIPLSPLAMLAVFVITDRELGGRLR
jgi:alpha-1,2-mannosyltransferase